MNISASAPTSGGGATATKVSPGWGPLEPPAVAARIRPRRGSSGGSWRCASPAGWGRPAGGDRRRSGVDRAPGPGPARREPAAVDGPADRPGDPPDRDQSLRRAGPHRRQEARPGPRRRRPQDARPRSRGQRRHRRGGGYTHIHTAIDAYSRLAYSEIAGDETAANCVAFLDRAVAWFAAQGITIERILTDNGIGYRSHAWRDRCAELGIVHTRTRPYRPHTNGKVERFNRTLADEWAYARLWNQKQPSPRP